MTTITDFIDHYYRHYNALVLKSAARSYKEHCSKNGKVVLTMGGAMSTAEMGVIFAEMIRKDKIHAICCTGANLEEDVYNLVGHNDYVLVPNYRQLKSEDEVDFRNRHLCRVTDTLIPEDIAMEPVHTAARAQWKKAKAAGQRLFPHEHLYEILRSGVLKSQYQIDPKDSWLQAAMEKNLPIWVPGWEDSTLGIIFATECIKGNLDARDMRSGVEYNMNLSDWYYQTSKTNPIGMFQIGGGITGDFLICVVPMLRLDLEREDTPHWAYFCQIGDSTTSYGSYSGAPPNEKITWDKFSLETPTFVIESDATIVAPLVFKYVMGE